MNEPITKVQRIVRAEHVDHDWPATAAWVPCTIPVVLTSTPDDPFAVRITVDVGNTWMVAREVLTDGMSVPAGLGDVQVEPDDDDPNTTIVILDCGKGHAELRFNRDQLGCFLADSAHHQFTDITPELEQWLLTLAA